MIENVEINKYIEAMTTTSSVNVNHDDTKEIIVNFISENWGIYFFF